MDNETRDLIFEYIILLRETMNETTDMKTKDKLKKQIDEMAKDFNINL